MVCQTLLNISINTSICVGEVTALCTFDIAKGFDTISHSILLHKLAFYGCDPSSLNWFKSYLTGRTQTVKCNNHLSSELQISIGVPQGSVLGPFLFIIYIYFEKVFFQGKLTDKNS